MLRCVLPYLERREEGGDATLNATDTDRAAMAAAVNGSIKQTLTACIREYMALTKQLVDSLAVLAGAATADLTAAKQKTIAIMQQIVHADHNLHTAVAALKRHQEVQHRIAAVQRRISHKDSVVRSMAFSLRAVEAMLEEVLATVRIQLDAIQTCDQHPVDVQDLVSYAHKISYTTSPPPNWTPDQPLIMFRPPAPQEEQMRAGLLYSNSQGPPLSAIPVPPSQHDLDVSKPSFPLPFPVEAAVPDRQFVLPPGLPPMPKGWKPGDPIILSVPPVMRVPEVNIELDLNPELTEKEERGIRDIKQEDTDDVEWE